MTQQNSLKCSTWVQSQKQYNDLWSFPRQTIQYYSNPSLCPDQECWRSWSWTVLGRPKRPSRTNSQKRCLFHYRGLKCKSRKSRNTWSNRQIWPWNAEWSRAKTNRVLPRKFPVMANTLFQKHKRRLYTWTSPNGQHRNQIDYILCSQRWEALYSQQKQDRELTVAKIMNSLLPNSDFNWRK